MCSWKQVLLASSLAALLAACGDDGAPAVPDARPPGEGAGAPDAGRPDASPPPVLRTIPVTAQLDILFVVDDSESMKDEQLRLGNTLPALFDRLQGPEGLPDLHVGIVSTNMGAHPLLPQCTPEDSDDGALQSAFTEDPFATQCSDGSLSIDGSFLLDAPAAAGARATNYTGGLTDVLGCMIALGIDGCAFEQPLASMRRAFENPLNVGFLRADAALAVVFLTDEDDCSAFDSAVFDPTINGKDSALGPLDSFRCFEFGVQCNPDEPRQLGEKHECKPREESPYMVAVQDYVDHVRGLKPDPQQVVVAGIVGADTLAPDEPLEVILETKPIGEVFSLVPSCEVTDADGNLVAEATPAVRLRAFLDAFPGRNLLAPICEEQLTGPLYAVGGLIARAVDQRWCLSSDVDLAPGAPGVQDACDVRELRHDGDEPVEITPLAKCTSDTPAPGELPCWQLVSPSERCDGVAPVELVIRRAEAPSGTSKIEVRCDAM